MLAVREVGESNIVNLGELADVVGFTTNTLREIIRKNPDFPVEEEGSHGVAYRFDLDQVIAWWQSHAEQVAAAKAERKSEIDQMRLELFGEEPDPETKGFTPGERRAEIEMQLSFDKLRRQRGDLLDRTEVATILRQSFAELGKSIRQIAPALAREFDLDRRTRAGIDAGLRKEFNAIIDRLQTMLLISDK